MPRQRKTYRSRRSRPKPIRRALAVATLLLVALLIWATAARLLAPKSNTARQTFDAILILGTPADSDGNPTPLLLDRVTEGVHEYQRGIAPRILVTGGAAHNRFVEAEVMARVAHAQGVPTANILKETHAQNTIENACYSAQILKAHGWHSAEIVSTDTHLPRAAMIFSHLDEFEWRTHPAPRNLASTYEQESSVLLEVIKTARYLAWSQWANRC